MSKKNMLGMDMLEWKHLSGLADPYKLALAEAGVQAGVPAVAGRELAESDTEFNLKRFEKDYQEPSDDDDDDKNKEVVKVPKAFQGRSGEMKRMAKLALIRSRAESPANKEARGIKKLKTGPATKLSDYSDKQRTRIMRKAAERAEGEEVTFNDVWGVFLEERGSSVDEFDRLLNLAIESGDEEMAAELLAMEDQLDEILGGAGKAVGWVAGKAVQGAQNLAQGVKAGYNSAKAPVPGAAPAGGGAPAGGTAPAPAPTAPTAPAAAPKTMIGGVDVTNAPRTAHGGIDMIKARAAAGAPAGGGAPAGATPPAGAPPQAPAGATPPPAPNGGAQAAATVSPGAPPKKPGLLGRLVGGAAKAIGGVVGAAKSGYAAGRGQPQVASVDAEDFELFIGEEHGLSAEQYIEICEHAFATNDVQMIECINVMEEGVFDFLESRLAEGGGSRASKAERKYRRFIAGVTGRVDASGTHGQDLLKHRERAQKDLGSVYDTGVKNFKTGEKLKGYPAAHDVPPSVQDKWYKSPAYRKLSANRGYDTAAYKKSMEQSMESVIAKQLQYSGYTDEYIEARTGGQLDEIFGLGKKARATKAADKERRVASLGYAAAQRNKDLDADDDKERALRRLKQDQHDIDRRLPALKKKGAEGAEIERKAAAERRKADHDADKHRAQRPWMTTGQ